MQNTTDKRAEALFFYCKKIKKVYKKHLTNALNECII
nr:MAG TPA: hypothetical protein [Caudoviricetes sp.]